MLGQNEKVVELLLEANADLNSSRDGWGTSLQIGASKGNEFVIRHLLEGSTDVNLHCKGDFGGVRDPNEADFHY